MIGHGSRYSKPRTVTNGMWCRAHKVWWEADVIVGRKLKSVQQPERGMVAQIAIRPAETRCAIIVLSRLAAIRLKTPCSTLLVAAHGQAHVIWISFCQVGDYIHELDRKCRDVKRDGYWKKGVKCWIWLGNGFCAFYCRRTIPPSFSSIDDNTCRHASVESSTKCNADQNVNGKSEFTHHFANGWAGA